jgi:hypothetical protein
MRNIPNNTYEEISGISRSGCCGEEKIPTPCGTRTPAIHSVASDFNDFPGSYIVPILLKIHTLDLRVESKYCM